MSEDTSPPYKEDYHGVYRERACLVAFLARTYPSVIWEDKGEPDWPIVYMVTQEGQLSWHISADDLDLFGGVPSVNDAPNPWDGHTTEEKYRRLSRLQAIP